MHPPIYKQGGNFIRKKGRRMEKGKIRSISGYSGGTIENGQGRLINFTLSNVVGRDRSNLKIGAFVWFETVGGNRDTNAINVRKC